MQDIQGYSRDIDSSPPQDSIYKEEDLDMAQYKPVNCDESSIHNLSERSKYL